VRTALLFGASRGVGFELARSLRRAGVRVVAMLRSDAGREELRELGVELIRGDAMDERDIQAAFELAGEAPVVVSSLGGSRVDGMSVDEHGNIRVIDRARRHGVERLVLVTSLGCGEMLPYRSERARQAFGASVEAKTRAEDHLRATELPFTILRPGGLRSEPATGRGILTTDPEMHGFIHREDVAELVHRILLDPSTERGVYAAVDSAFARCVNPVDPVPLRPL